ncbi:T9SS type A sorting domain-containing protein [Oceanihabitans sp. IOP_32]|uniref:T9SS type A sorting domain-containing protein n=1 Tax=Oceanihabitans sp. IOP_32 TaxID=2529032 RepID=UPI00188546F5|nr:T9SS type A sorting domain-containing protein [Oceanihabitans sp. IOP_32]
MKKIFFVSFILFASISNSQEKYQIEFYNLNYRINKGVKNSTNSNINIKIHFDDGTEETLYFRPIRNRGDNEVNYKIDPIIIRNKRPTKISCYVHVNFRTGTDANSTKNITINPPCNEGFFDEGYSPRMTNVSFNYKVHPLLSLKHPPNTLIGFNDAFTFSTKDDSLGFPTSFYNWQYQIVASGSPLPNGWFDMPYSTQGDANPTIVPSTFINKVHIGKRIYLRVVSCNYYTSNETIFYELTRSAPHINSAQPKKTTCYNAIDGSVNFNFDRDLLNGENFNISLTNTTLNTDHSEENIENDIINRNYKINNLPPGTYVAQVFGGDIIGYGGVPWNTYVESAAHKATFNITKPSPVEFTATHTNVNCNEGSDGSITIKATGGTGNYKYVINEQAPLAFSNGSTHIETGLPNGSYTIKVLDSNDCLAQKISRDSNDNIIGSQGVLTETILITQPDEPVSVEFPLDGVQEPTAFGFSNGSITAKINGGTKFLDDSYSFTWKYFDSQTATWINWSTFNYDFDTTTKDWFIILKNAKAGDYKLTVTDANYTNATNTAGCTIIDAPFTLKQPPLLELEIIETKAISCNNTNTFGNPWSDGELTAIATGGVPFNPLINGEHAYRYIWKKKDSTGVYKVISGEISKVLSNIDVGDYAVNIIDANGITIGTSLNNVVTPVDVLTTIKQPDLLEVTLKKEDVSCVSGNDGSATVSITGGIPPYTIQWANGQNTATATGLTANNHVVYVTDARGCMATGNITIDQPNGIQIETLKKTLPTCYGGNDGSIELQITGGELPYTYSWSTGEATTSIQNLSEGIYTFKLTDANGCVAFKEIVLEDPNKIEIDLDADRTLCKNQYYNLDASIDDPHATYLWTSNNGFSSTNAQISVTEAGIYEVTATTALGCTATDSVIITTDDIEIDVEFLLSSQAYVEEDVILFNVSDPLGENSNWDIPKNVTIVNQTKTSITLRFPEANTYKIGLTSTQGSCYANQYKNIVVEDRIGLPSSGDAKNPFIEAFSLTPNPNTGQFQIVIHLTESSPIAIRVFDVHGGFVLEHLTQHTAKDYTIPMQVSLQAGVYFVVLETAKETQVKRMIAK